MRTVEFILEDNSCLLFRKAFNTIDELWSSSMWYRDFDGSVRGQYTVEVVKLFYPYHSG